MLIARRYQIDNLRASRIGRGGMGDVFRARDTATGEDVAVKHLQAHLVAGNAQLVERFLREGEVLRRLNRPNIVKVLDAVKEDDDHYIIMEYIAGGSLRDLLGDAPQLPLARVLTIGLGIVDALTRAHHLNIIHRDIKPGNILLGDDGTPYLTDFGLAQAGDMSHITAPGALPGTYAYVAPEIYQGSSADTRSDIWSLGVVLFEMLTGRLPFAGPSVVTVMNAIMTRPIPDMGALRPDVPEALVTLIQQMLAKQPDQRLGSARLVGAQLEMIRDPRRPNRERFTVPGPEATAPALGPRHNLPAQPTPFVGRAAEIRTYASLLSGDDCRLLTLVGPGGMGKTRLAIETARQLLDHFEHGVRFVALAPAESASRALPAVAAALQLTFMENEDPWERLVAYLREKRMLLVLDNFEHVLDAAPRLAQLLNLAPGVKALTTSREALNISQEWVRAVEGLPYPAAADAADPAAYAALQLFAERARRYRVDFDLQAELPAVIEICRLADGMPLAIELAATWLRTAPAAQIASEIGRNLDFLSTNLRDVPDRHRSMRAVFDYSWNRLEEDERRALANLSIFRGGLTAAAAGTVADASLLTLNSLVNKSLVREIARDDRGSRYEMHRLVAQYAAQQLTTSPDRAAAVAADHSVYYLELLARQEAALKGHGQRAALNLIVEELDNIRKAWQGAIARAADDPDAWASLAAGVRALTLFCEMRGLINEGEQLLAAAVEAVAAGMSAGAGKTGGATETDGRLALARLYAGHAQFLFRLNRFQVMEARLTAGRRLLNELPESAERAYESAFNDILRCLFLVRNARSQEMQPLVEAALETFADQSDVWAQILALNTSTMYLRSGKEVLAVLKRTVELSKGIGDQISHARALLNLSQSVGDPEEALPILHETLDLYKEIGHRPGTGLVYEWLGDANRRQGNAGEAQRYFEKALSVYADVGYRSRLAHVLRWLAINQYELGNPEHAERSLEKMAHLLKEAGDPVGYIQSLSEIAQLQLDQGLLTEERIRRTYHHCLQLANDVHVPAFRVEVLDRIGKLALDLGEYQDAEAHFQEMAQLALADENWSAAGWAHFHLARVFGALGCYEDTAAQLEQCLPLFERAASNEGLIRALDLRGRLAFVQGEPGQALADYQTALAHVTDYWSHVAGVTVLLDGAVLQLKSGRQEQGLAALLAVVRHPFFSWGPIAYRDRRRVRRVLDHYRTTLDAEAFAAVEQAAAQLNLDELYAQLRDLTGAEANFL